MSTKLPRIQQPPMWTGNFVGLALWCAAVVTFCRAAVNRLEVLEGMISATDDLAATSTIGGGGSSAGVKVKIVPGELVSKGDVIQVSPAGAKRANAGTSPVAATDWAAAVSGGYVVLGGEEAKLNFESGGETGPDDLLVYLARTPGMVTRLVRTSYDDADAATWSIRQVLGWQRAAVEPATQRGAVKFLPQAANGA